MSAGVISKSTTPRQLAEAHHPDFNWAEYNRLDALRTEGSFAKLGCDRTRRRLTDKEPVKEVIKMTEQQLALMKTGDGFIAAEKSMFVDEEQAIDFIKGIYMKPTAQKSTDGKKVVPLTLEEVKQVAKVAFNLGLNPLPFMGEMHASKRWVKVDVPDTSPGAKPGATRAEFELQFMIIFGYKGLIKMLIKQGRDIDYEARPMTDEERKGWGVKDKQIAFICEMYDFHRVKKWKENTGRIPAPWVGVGVGKDDAENINGKPAGFIAEIRAIRGALYKAGATMQLSPEDLGMKYDAGANGLVSTLERRAELPEGYTFDIEGEHADCDPDLGALQPADAAATADMSVGEAVEPTETKAAVETSATMPENAPEATSTAQEATEATPAPTIQEIAKVRPALSPADLKTKFNQWRNSELEKKLPGDREAIGAEMAAALLSQFEDICSQPDARNFILHLTGRSDTASVKVLERRIIQDEILSVPDRAKTEIETYIRVFGLSEKAQPAPEGA